MQVLLTGKVRFEVDKWEKVKLKQIVEQFIVPMRDKPKVFDGNIPWCRIEDFNGKYLFNSKSNKSVSEKIIVDMNLKICPVDTVLVSCSATLGVCAIVKNPLITNQTFIGLVPNKERVNEEFLFYMMGFLAYRLKVLSSGTTIAYLSRKEFEKFKINLPPLSEQKKIAKVLSTCDQEIEKLIEQQLFLESQKKGLMQQLLTGATRVKV